MAATLIVGFGMIPRHRRVLDRVVHPVELRVCPRVIGFGWTMFDVACLTDQTKPHVAECDAVPIARRPGKLDAIVGQMWARIRVDLSGTAPADVQETPMPSCDEPSRPTVPPRAFAGAVNGHKEMAPAVLSPDFGIVDMERADRVT